MFAMCIARSPFVALINYSSTSVDRILDRHIRFLCRLEHEAEISVNVPSKTLVRAVKNDGDTWLKQ
jgi:hypothetical protein